MLVDNISHFIPLFERAGAGAGTADPAPATPLFRSLITILERKVFCKFDRNKKMSRSQCYDGYSTMKGEKNYVTKQIKDEDKRALLTYCFTHSFNLAVDDSY